MPQPTYAELADALREVADRIASFDDRDIAKPNSLNLYLSFGYLPSHGPQMTPAVDAIAAALGVTAATKVEGRGTNRTADHKAEHREGPLRVVVRTSVEPPPLKRRSTADMQAELDRLNNELAEARRSQA
ncbi:hypothetical protein [Actinoplanes sp. NPDC049599]|uniref:hypothetical protein n=1 Tax=Actinoplanes sp. NPDC049599 TaxID=3363903 RepID=UPI0037B468BE